MGKRFFLLFDTDRNGELDFTEFVMCTWNYLTLDDICLIDLGNALIPLRFHSSLILSSGHPSVSLPTHVISQKL